MLRVTDTQSFNCDFSGTKITRTHILYFLQTNKRGKGSVADSSALFINKNIRQRNDRL